jgi:hypothetical protein
LARRDHAGHFLSSGEIHVPDHLISQEVHAKVNHHRAGFDPVAFDHLCPPHRGAQDVAAAANGGKVGGE